MIIKFNVHGVNRVQLPMPAKVEGEDVMAQVSAVEVELTTDSPLSGSLTLRFFGKEMAEAEKTFLPDTELSADFVNLG